MPVAHPHYQAVLPNRKFPSFPCIYREPGCISMAAGEANADADL
jgi:hypothetical protein